MAKLSESVRLRLREEMARLDLSQRDVAGLLDWSQSKVAHILTGHVETTVDDLAAFCFAVGIRVTEAVRDRGMEFCAEMTPTELRVLEQIRQLDQSMYTAMLTFLQIKKPESRRAAPPVKKLKISRS